jgi:hypothetical protein
MFQEKCCLNNPPEKGIDHGGRHGNFDKVTGNMSEDCFPSGAKSLPPGPSRNKLSCYCTDIGQP